MATKPEDTSEEEERKKTQDAGHDSHGSPLSGYRGHIFIGISF